MTKYLLVKGHNSVKIYLIFYSMVNTIHFYTFWTENQFK
jgi:hypothetical protein